MPANVIPTDRTNPLPVARIVWGALVAAVLTYAVVLQVLLRNPATAADPQLVGTLRTVCIAIAVLQSAAIWLLHRRYLVPALERAPGSSVARDPQRTFTFLVVCWALAETIALYGLVVGMIGRQQEPLFFVWALAVLVLCRPRPEHFG
jgi:F0F1-type ATP synthase membrane subunit c/vacuolar-type H+-ATPase subunit K